MGAASARSGARASAAAMPAGLNPKRPEVITNASTAPSCAKLSASDTPANHSTASTRSSAAVRLVDAGWMMTHLWTHAQRSTAHTRSKPRFQ